MLHLCLKKLKINNNNIKTIINKLNYDGKNISVIKRTISNKINIPIDDKNIVSSKYKNINLFDGYYLHDYIFKNVDKWLDKTAVICSESGKSYTYAELKNKTSRLVASFKKMNLRPGDTIATVLPNLPEYAIIILAASQAGLKLTLINPIYTAAEINKQLVNSETSLVVSVSSRYPVVAQSITGIKSIKHPIVIVDYENNTRPSGTIKFDDLVVDNNHDGNIGEFKNTNHDNTNDTVLLPYSSGTTGLPKGVELTHRNIVSNLAQIDHENFKIMEQAIGNYQEVIPVFLPIYHIYSYTMLLCDGLSNGAKLITMPTFTSNTFLDVLNKHRVTNLYVAPPVLQLIANDERFKKKHIESLKELISGGAPAGEEIMNKIKLKLGDSFMFSQGYGMSETSPLLTRGKNGPYGSVGQVVPNTDMRIVGVDEDNLGQNLDIDKIGEIQASGPQVMKGYFKNPQATSETMDGKWLKTGDLGNFDKDGNLWITGRMKELIKVKGLQVSPPELEDLLHSHDKISDVAVIGVPHDRFGEIPKAFVVAKQGVQINEDEIKKFVAEKVADYKQLGHVVFIDQIPKSPAGKILRRQLQKM